MGAAHEIGSFVKTEKQIEACSLLNKHENILLTGGSRSGKTTIAIRNIILRAMKRKSRHLICRFRFNHAKTSLWYDTIPKVLRLCFPGLAYKENKADWFIQIPCRDGGYSEIWIGGVDDDERVEKILGNEYSTIYANECSQISYPAILMLETRLAENSGLELKFYFDENPPTKRHWSYQYLIKGITPGTKKKHKLDVAHLHMNPMDNVENLPKSYLKRLNGLPKKERDRFFLGLFGSGVEGALWDELMIQGAQFLQPGEPTNTVIAVDPTVSHNKDSDECGIVAVSKDDLDQGIVHEDLSDKLSTNQWAQRVVQAYWHYEANAVVAEVNQGGDLVEDVLRNIDPNIKVVKVHASKGKFARAEPVAALYEQGRVHHEEDLIDLEDQLVSYVPLDSKSSPDRLDALVWGLTYLIVAPEHRRNVRVHTGADEEEEEDDDEAAA